MEKRCIAMRDATYFCHFFEMLIGFFITCTFRPGLQITGVTGAPSGHHLLGCHAIARLQVPLELTFLNVQASHLRSHSVGTWADAFTNSHESKAP